MYVLKIITTVLICLMILIIAWFDKDFTWEKDKAGIVGFGFMEVVYILSLICMWF